MSYQTVHQSSSSSVFCLEMAGLAVSSAIYYFSQLSQPSQDQLHTLQLATGFPLSFSFLPFVWPDVPYCLCGWVWPILSCRSGNYSGGSLACSWLMPCAKFSKHEPSSNFSIHRFQNIIMAFRSLSYVHVIGILLVPETICLGRSPLFIQICD